MTEPTPTPQDDTQAQGLKIIEAHHAKLNDMLSQMTHIDFEKTFAPYLQGVQQQPLTPPMPSRGEAFARAFGSKEGSSSVMGQIGKSYESSADRNRQLLETKRGILEMKAKQEIDAGEADKALKTQQAREELEWNLGQLEHAQGQKEAKEKEQRDFEAKQKLQDAKLASAERVAKDKLAAKVKEAGGDDKILGIVLKGMFAQKLAAANARYHADPVLGTYMTPEQIAQETIDQMGDFKPIIDAARKSLGYSDTHPTGTGTTTPPPAAAPSKARQIADRMAKEEANKGKGKP